MEKNILITGSNGQIGKELAESFIQKNTSSNIICLDLIKGKQKRFKFYKCNILDYEKLNFIFKKEKINEVYHLAAYLSAKAENDMNIAWKVNMDGLQNILELSKKYNVKKVFWPSSIAVFGEDAKKTKTKQNEKTNPNSIYGITKVLGESLCEFFFKNYKIDVRSVRFPGLIGHKSMPGGGTTDYAVDIFYSAVKEEQFSCFLKENTLLPMMHMDDAIRAIHEIMNCESKQIKIRTSYNISGCSFNPKNIFDEIKKYINEFKITYKPDFRQNLAESWPNSIDDTEAKKDWHWKSNYKLSEIVKSMLENIK
tara:strand:- start:127 stop:1056 length:930 start_codon:yes stop_codon:yes gene_type:complete